MPSTPPYIVGFPAISSSDITLDTQLDDVAALDYTGNAGKVVAVNAGETAFELVTGGGGSGLTSPQVLARTLGA